MVHKCLIVKPGKQRNESKDMKIVGTNAVSSYKMYSLEIMQPSAKAQFSNRYEITHQMNACMSLPSHLAQSGGRLPLLVVRRWLSVSAINSNRSRFLT